MPIEFLPIEPGADAALHHMRHELKVAQARADRYEAVLRIIDGLPTGTPGEQIISLAHRALLPWPIRTPRRRWRAAIARWWDDHVTAPAQRQAARRRSGK